MGPPYYSEMVKKGQSWEAADPSAYRYCFMFLPCVLHRNTEYVFAQMGTASGHLLSAGPNKLKFISMQTQLNGCYSKVGHSGRTGDICTLPVHLSLVVCLSNHTGTLISLIMNSAWYYLAWYSVWLPVFAWDGKQQSNIRLVLYCWKKQYTCDQTNSQVEWAVISQGFFFFRIHLNIEAYTSVNWWNHSLQYVCTNRFPN